jgi:hypothetical protein
MPTADVTNQALNIIVDLYDYTLNEFATSNADYQRSSAPLVTALPMLPSNLQAQLMPLTPYLTPTIGAQFNQAWQSAQAGEETQAATSFTAQAKASGADVSNVTCTFAASGNVIASIIPATASQPANLSLIYGLPGGNFHFYSGPLGAGWKIDFDAAVAVSTPVPVKPFTLTTSVVSTLYNASMHTDNFGADVDSFLSGLITDLGNFFTQSDAYESIVDISEAAASEQTDQSAPVTGAVATQFGALFSALNSSGPACAADGISQCAFSIVDNSTLTLTLTHPLDPGPTIENVDSPLPGTVLANPPALAASASQALPGEQISVLGTGFPVDTTTQLSLEWPNTSTGTAKSAQISQDGVVTTLSTPAGLGQGYAYKTPHLQPGVSYSFQARCADTLTWSRWGPRLIASTASTNMVVLMLIPAAVGAVTAAYQVGSAALATVSGPWTCKIKIPGGAVPGPYTLTATLAGQFLASTQFTVTGALAPVLETIDASTGIIVSPPMFGGEAFTVRGQGFPVANGSTVAVTVDGVTAATPTASGGQFTATLTTPGDPYTTGTVTVTATGGGVSASLNPPISLLGQPK